MEELKGQDPGEACALASAHEAPSLPVEPTEIRHALQTVLGWRKNRPLAFDGDATAFPSHHDRIATTPGETRALEFGGLCLRLISDSILGDDPTEEIPKIVIDSMLSRIVEAHFTVWYIWHVPTGTMIVPGMHELLGIPSREVPTIVEEWLARVHPEDLPRMVAENDAAIRANSAFRSEYRLRRGDGGYLSISDRGIVTPGGDGQAEWMAGGLRDITLEKSLAQAREESAQLREALFRKALMPVFLIDGGGLVVDVSDSTTRLFQVHRDQLLGQPAVSIFPESLGWRTVGLDAPQANGRATPEACEIEVDIAGTRRWLLATVVPFLVGDEQMAFVLGVDVTERKRALKALAMSEAALRDKTRDLERHNVALEVLMEQRRSDLKERGYLLAENLERLVLPTLDRLAAAFSDYPEASLIDVVKKTLKEIATPLLDTSGSPSPVRSHNLTRREYEVLQLVRAGKTTDQISRTLHLSPATVTFHRGNVRRKFGLHGSGISLSQVEVSTVMVSGDSSADTPAGRGGAPESDVTTLLKLIDLEESATDVGQQRSN